MAKLISARLIPYKGKVHDLTVSNTHSYSVEELGVHNSAAGSLVSYALGITQLDPVKYGLLFERFISIGRSATPMIFDRNMRTMFDTIEPIPTVDDRQVANDKNHHTCRDGLGYCECKEKAKQDKSEPNKQCH